MYQARQQATSKWMLIMAHWLLLHAVRGVLPALTHACWRIGRAWPDADLAGLQHLVLYM